MRGKPYDVAIDRVRRAGQRTPLRAGRAADRPARATRSTSARAMRGSPKARSIALAEAAIAEFEEAHGRFPGARAGHPRARPARRRRADPRLRPRPHLSVHAIRRREASDGAKPLGPADYFNRLANRVTAALSVPTAAGPLYDVDTRLRPQGDAGDAGGAGSALSPTISASEAWTWEHMALCRARPVFGSAPARVARSADADRRASSGSRATRANRRRRGEDARRDGGAQSRRPGRSTSSLGRAGWSTWSSRCTCSS